MDTHHIAVLLEQIVEQNKAVLEAIGAMQEKVNKIDTIGQRLEDLETDMKVVKAAITDMSDGNNSLMSRWTPESKHFPLHG